MTPKNAIYVAGADGELGSFVVEELLEMPNRYPHLPNIPVYAGVHEKSTTSSLNASMIVEVDPINHPEPALHALKRASKLLLLVDPLSDKIKQKDVLAFAKGYIDAAKQANIEHIIFPTPFSKIDAPCSPPLTPVGEDNGEQNVTRSFRDQFEEIESSLRESFSRSQITILRYPGVLNQHLLFFAEYIMENSKLPIINNSRMIFECCDMSDVVRALSHILFCPVQRHGGKEYKITGPNLLTSDEIAIKASLGLGREINVELMTLKQIRNVIMEEAEKVAYLLELWGLQGSARKVQVTRDLEIITGSSGKSLREFFENSQHAFTSPQTG